MCVDEQKLSVVLVEKIDKKKLKQNDVEIFYWEHFCVEKASRIIPEIKLVFKESL